MDRIMHEVTAKDLISNIEHFPKLSKEINKFISTLDLKCVAPELRCEYVMLKMQSSDKFQDLFSVNDLG